MYCAKKNHHYCNLFLNNEKTSQKLERHKQEFILPRDLTKHGVYNLHDAITENEQKKSERMTKRVS